MPKFVYLGGQTRSEHMVEATDDRGRPMIVDERDGVDMPDITVAFGVKFIAGQPTDVEEHMFRDKAAFNHAVSKLKGNQHFELAAQDVEFVEVKDDPAPAPKAKAAPKAKPQTPPEPASVE